MSNPIKYTTGTESQALKKGNFYIGTGAVGKGPTNSTGYYNGISPATNGYTIYLYREGAPGNLSYHSATNDSQLISFTNNLAGTSYTGVQQCFDYYYGQTDKVLVNQDYPADFPYIVMDGLVLYLDASISQSYPGSGTTWSDINGLGPKNNGTLINGPTFNSSNGGNIKLDGVDDYITFGSLSNSNSSNYTLIFGFKSYSGANSSDGYRLIGATGGSTSQLGYSFDNSNLRIWFGNWNIFDSSVSANNVYIVAQSSNTNVTNMYVNGVYKTQYNVQPPFFNSLGFGQPYVFCCGSYFVGEFYFIQYYNKALSATEVLQNFNAQKGRFGL